MKEEVAKMSKIRQAKKKPQKQENTQPTLDQIAEGHTLQKDLFEIGRAHV